MIVLVDSSIWIEFFKPKPLVPIAPLEWLIEEKRAAICRPIMAEVLSGRVSATLQARLARDLDALLCMDPDWNSSDIWNKVVDLAAASRQKGLGIPGLVDRMILVAVMESSSTLWTLDKKLLRLAKGLGAKTYDG